MRTLIHPHFLSFWLPVALLSTHRVEAAPLPPTSKPTAIAKKPAASSGHALPPRKPSGRSAQTSKAQAKSATSLSHTVAKPHTTAKAVGAVARPKATPASAQSVAAAMSLADQRMRADQAAAPITLEDAIATALLNNPQRAAAQAAVRAAEANIKTAKSAGKVQVDLSGNGQISRNVSTTTGTTSTSTGSGGTSGSSGSSGTVKSETLSVGATLPVYTGGRVKANTRVAQFNAEAQQAQEKQVEQDLVLNTTLAYLNILRAQELLTVADSNLRVSTERLRVATVRYSVGASARLDVLQARTDLADARQRRITAANAVGQADANLNTLLGRAPETPVRVQLITSLRLPPVLTLAATQAASAPTGAIRSIANTTLANTATNPARNATTTGVPGTASLPGAGGTTTATNTTGNTTATGTTAPRTTTATTGNTTTVAAVPGTNATTTGTNTTGVATSGTTTATNTGTATGAATTTTGTNTTAATSTTSAGLQTIAGTSRQSLAVTQAQLRAAQAELELAQAQRRPSLGLTLTGLLRNPATFLGHFGTAIGLGLGQTLFDSGRIRSQVEQAQAIVEQNRQNLAGQSLEVANAIESNLLTLDSAQRRLTDADAGVVSAREALRIAQIGFRAGVRTTLDLSSAQASLLSAGTDAVNARFDVASSQAQLAATVGLYTAEAQSAYERTLREEQERHDAAEKVAELPPAKKKKRHKFLGLF